MTVIPFTGSFVSDRRNGVDLPHDDEYETLTMYPVMPIHPLDKIVSGIGEAVRGVLKLEEVAESDPEYMATLPSVKSALTETRDRITALLDEMERRKWIAALKLEGKSCN